MENFEYQIMQPSDENIIMTEEMRLRSYGLTSGFTADEYYIEEILSGRILVFLCLHNDKPVSACYVSDFQGSLFIDYVFVLPEYQNTGLRLGRKLISYILENKALVEDYFNKEFKHSRLSAPNDKNRAIYKTLGYELDKPFDMMSKKLP